jgi:hypothetical protein
MSNTGAESLAAGHMLTPRAYCPGGPERCAPLFIYGTPSVPEHGDGYAW